MREPPGSHADGARMNVDDLVATRVAAARVHIQAAKRRRAELSAARRRGLAARHAQKLRNLRSQDSSADVGQPPTPATQKETP